MNKITKFIPNYRNIWTLTFPLIIVGASEATVTIIDTIFLAHYGTTELAALGLASTIYILSLFLIYGFVDGIQILIGRRAGEEQPKQIGKVLNQGLYILMALCAVIIVLVLSFVPMATVKLFESQGVHTAVNLYLGIAIFSLFFHAFNLALSTFYVGISRTNVFIGATLVLAITNISLDYLLIFGNFGFEEMGIEGAAIASLVAEAAFSLVLIIDIKRRRYIDTYGLLVFEKVDTAIMRTLTILSTPVSLDVLVESLRWFLFFLIIEHLGENTLAVTTIIFSYYTLLLISVDAFAETVSSMISNLIGQKDNKQIGKMISKTILLSFVSIVPMLIITYFYAEPILSIFSEDQTMIDSAMPILVVIVLATLIAIPADIISASVAGTGDTTVTLVIEIIVSTTILVYTYYAAFVADFSLTYIWFAEVIGWLVCLVLSWSWLYSGAWKRLNI